MTVCEEKEGWPHEMDEKWTVCEGCEARFSSVMMVHVLLCVCTHIQ